MLVKKSWWILVAYKPCAAVLSYKFVSPLTVFQWASSSRTPAPALVTLETVAPLHLEVPWAPPRWREETHYAPIQWLHLIHVM